MVKKYNNIPKTAAKRANNLGAPSVDTESIFNVIRKDTVKKSRSLIWTAMLFFIKTFLADLRISKKMPIAIPDTKSKKKAYNSSDITGFILHTSAI